jgi:DNA-binding transcriptional LysR family regulator
MAKAAAALRVTQPAVSQVIAELEHALGVKLLDRHPRGVDASAFGEALLRGGNEAFDSLRQSLREIDFLSNPMSGEVNVGCPETVAALLPPIIENFSNSYPKIVLHVREVAAPTLDLPPLRQRVIDFAILRVAGPPERYGGTDDLELETLFNDRMLIVVGRGSALAHRAKITFADLAEEPWILPPANTLTSEIVTEAFLQQALGKPRVSLVTFSVSLRANLVAAGRYVTVLPRSMLRHFADRMSLTILPIELPKHEWPVVLATLKYRTLNPAARLFLDEVRHGIANQHR